MDILNLIKDGDIIITPYEVKKEILKEISKKKLFHHFRFFTKKEIIEKSLFIYDLNTIAYLMENYEFRVENAIMYLNNLYYIDNKTYNIEKLDFLVKIKKELTRMKLLKEDNLFKQLVLNKRVIVVGYQIIDNLFNRALNELNKVSEVQIIEFENKEIPKLDVFHYHHLNDEVNGVAVKICELIEQGININKIKLSNVNNSYYYTLNKIFNLYNIPINLKNESSLYELKMGRFFLDDFKVSKNINHSLENIINSFNLNDTLNKDIYNRLINVLNEVIKIDTSNPDTIYELLVYLFKNNKIQSYYFDNAVEIVSLNDYYFNDDEYVFLLNFSEETCPRKYKDKEFLSDDLAPYLSLDTIIKKNQKEKDALIKTLSNIKNLFISYHDTSSFSEQRPSLLIKELKMNVVEGKLYPNNITYSPRYDQIFLARNIDEFILYRQKHPLLETLYSNYQQGFDYNQFENKFNMITYTLTDKTNLSYTRLDTFFACKFRYYLDYVLKLSRYESTFHQFIGNLFHFVLSKIDDEDFNVNTLFDEYVNENQKELTPKEEMLLIRLKEELIDSTSFIKEHLNQTKYKIEATEKEILIDYDEHFNLKAFVDKIMTYQDEEGNKYFVIIDYKTGYFTNKLDYIKDGINVQLPFYYYIIKQDPTYKDYHLGGIYLENVIVGNITKDLKKSLAQLKRNALKLVGYSNSNPNIIAKFDSTFENSEFIRSMKLKKDGTFYKNAKVMDKEQIKKFYDLIKELLNNAIKDIKNGNFEINPIEIKEVFHSCQFCPYEDICFKTYKDYREPVLVSESEGETNEY